MTDAPETDASFLAPVSGACVISIRDHVIATRRLEIDGNAVDTATGTAKLSAMVSGHDKVKFL